MIPIADFLKIIAHRMVRRYPALAMKLRQAGFAYNAEDFLKRTLFSALIMTFGLSFVLLALVKTFELPKFFFLVIPIIFFGLFFFFMHSPDVKIMREQQQIGSEIVFAGRFLLIEMESGIPVYTAMLEAAKNYERIGKYLSHIIRHVDMGTPIEEAINQEVELTPSEDLRKVLWQILNALRTGADASKSLRAVIEQIVREQHIAITEYGRKLNPLAMFYMIIAIIIPTLGITMLVVLSTLVSLPLDFTILMVLLLFIAFMQFMFLSVIRSSRPPVGI